MSDFSFFKTHRTWEDWLGMLLGVLIVLSPWFPTQTSHEMLEAERSFIVLNTFTVGLLVFGLAQLEYVALQRWEEVAEILLGLWLIVSPYMSLAIPARGCCILAYRVSAALSCCSPPCSSGRTGI